MIIIAHTKMSNARDFKPSATTLTDQAILGDCICSLGCFVLQKCAQDTQLPTYLACLTAANFAVF